MSGWPGAVGNKVQNAGGLTSWVRFGAGDTQWQADPGSGSRGGISPDGGVQSPLAGLGTGVSPLIEKALRDAVCVDAIGPITLSGVQTIDGQSAGAGTCLRVLVLGQVDQTTNGPYLAGSGAWTRTSDFATASQMVPGALFPVLNGTSLTTGAGSVWMFQTQSAITVGTTALTFSQVIGSGALANQTLAQARLALAPPVRVTVTGASVQEINLTPLAGDVAGAYFVAGNIICGHGGATFKVQPNGSDSNLSGFFADYSVGSGKSTTNWPLYSTNGALTGVGLGFTISFHGFFYTKSGVNRFLQIKGLITTAANGDVWNEGIMADTTTVITSIDILASTSDGIAAGSWFEVVPLNF